MVSHMESSRVEFLLRRLEQVQSSCQDIEKEAGVWISRSACGSAGYTELESAALQGLWEWVVCLYVCMHACMYVYV